MENKQFEIEQNLLNALEQGALSAVVIFGDYAYTVVIENNKKVIYRVILSDYLTAMDEIEKSPVFLEDPTDENFWDLMSTYISEISDASEVVAIL